MTWQRSTSRLWTLSAAGLVAVVVLAGACEEEPTDPSTSTPPGPTTPVEPTDTGLPDVASVAPQEEPVEATLDETVTLTGASLFGDDAATIEMTLSEPEVLTEVALDTGATLTPERDVYAVFETVIEGVEGTYSFNPTDMHLIPSEDVTAFRDDPFAFDPGNPTEPTSIAELDAISFGDVSAGDRLSGNLVFDVSESALEDAAIVLKALLLVEGPPAAYWLLA